MDFKIGPTGYSDLSSFNFVSGDVEVRANRNAIPPSDLSSQEFVSMKNWHSSESYSINGVNGKHRDVEGVERDASSSGPFSIHAGLDEITNSPDNRVSLASLDSSIKYFKSTVQQLFDDFYSNINHFDEFEKTFSNFLEQKGNELDIDALIKGMMEHRTEDANKDLNTISSNRVENGQVGDVYASFGTTSYESRNALYSKDNSAANKGYGVHVKSHSYIFKEVAPYEQKMCQLLSDIEINKNVRIKTSQVTFSDNLKNFYFTKKKLLNYLHGHKQINKKTSLSKVEKKCPNLESLDEEITEQEHSKYDQSSFLVKICHYLCKKIRKNTCLD